MANQLFVSRLGGRVATALRENGELVELRVEEAGDALAVGDIVKGRVAKVLPGIQAAFVDLGSGPDAFLHAADLFLAGEVPPETPEPDGGEDEEDDLDGIRRPARRSTARPLEQRLKEGREIVVQITRESLGTKGPRVTSWITLPGRHLVFAPHVPFRGVSRRVTDPAERERLRALAHSLLPAGRGFIVRTAGREAPEASLLADAARLEAAWQEIERRAARASAPARLHADGGLLQRSLRDAPRLGLDAIVIEGEDLFGEARAYLESLEPQLAGRIVRHESAVPLLDQEGIHAEIERALRPKVWLPSGGTIVIEPTEALVSIDVNTGKHVGAARPRETILETNLEAAREIARQLRLRDLGGIVVVDFIDMERAEDRERVVAELALALRSDPARTKVFGMSELGLLPLTRKRTRPGLRSALTRPCPVCGGGGRVKTVEMAAHEALLEVRRLAAGLAPTGIRVRAHPELALAMRTAIQSTAIPLGRETLAILEIDEDVSIEGDRFEVSTC